MPAFEGNTRTFTASAAVVRNRLVTVAAGDLCAHTALAAVADGVALNSAATGELVTVRLKNRGGTVELEAAGAFADGAVVYGRAAGEIDDVSADSAVAIGKALEASSGDGAVVEVLLY
jgi:hypothetical protein